MQPKPHRAWDPVPVARGEEKGTVPGECASMLVAGRAGGGVPVVGVSSERGQQVKGLLVG